MKLPDLANKLDQNNKMVIVPVSVMRVCRPNITFSTPAR